MEGQIKSFILENLRDVDLDVKTDDKDICYRNITMRWFAEARLMLLN